MRALHVCTCQNLHTVTVCLSATRNAQPLSEFRIRSFHSRRPKSPGWCSSSWAVTILREGHRADAFYTDSTGTSCLSQLTNLDRNRMAVIGVLPPCNFPFSVACFDAESFAEGNLLQHQFTLSISAKGKILFRMLIASRWTRFHLHNNNKKKKSWPKHAVELNVSVACSVFFLPLKCNNADKKIAWTVCIIVFCSWCFLLHLHLIIGLAFLEGTHIVRCLSCQSFKGLVVLHKTRGIGSHWHDCETVFSCMDNSKRNRGGDVLVSSTTVEHVTHKHQQHRLVEEVYFQMMVEGLEEENPL